MNGHKSNSNRKKYWKIEIAHSVTYIKWIGSGLRQQGDGRKACYIKSLLGFFFASFFPGFFTKVLWYKKWWELCSLRSKSQSWFIFALLNDWKRDLLSNLYYLKISKPRKMFRQLFAFNSNLHQNWFWYFGFWFQFCTIWFYCNFKSLHDL